MNELKAEDVRKIIKSAEQSNQRTGGSAFPSHNKPPFVENPDSGELVALYSTRGMSLLDHYAGLAMQSMVAGEGARMVANRDERYSENNWSAIVASNAYDFAEAMIAERNKRLAELKPEA